MTPGRNQRERERERERQTDKQVLFPDHERQTTLSAVLDSLLVARSDLKKCFGEKMRCCAH